MIIYNLYFYILLFYLHDYCISIIQHHVNEKEKTITILTNNGAIKGKIEDCFYVWKGIPFAQPPIGKNRWKPPISVNSWKPKILETTQFKPACPQRCLLPPSLCPKNISEDCLYLNIWTPKFNYSLNKNNLLPIMVFIAGGAFMQGDGSSIVYRGNFISCNTSTIVVTFNYRLGALGFMYIQNNSNIIGNYGIMDQRMLLEWIQKNIHYFGGDKNKITLFGESAGAISIGVHLTSSKSYNLFHKAIMESNPIAVPIKTPLEATQYGSKFCYEIGCNENDFNCLLSKNINEILDAQDATFPIPDPFTTTFSIVLPWDPTIDGNVVEQQPMTAFIKGNYNHIPIIMGTNKNEGVMFIYLILSFKIINIEYVPIIIAIFGEYSEKVLEEYPPPVDPLIDCRPLLSEVITHFLFTCSTRKVLQSISNNTITYLYFFNHILSFDAWGPRYYFCKDSVCHGSELPFVFHSQNNNDSFTPKENLLSINIIHYWTNFAKSLHGNPNYLNHIPIYWYPFNIKNNWFNIKFSTPINFQFNLLKEKCDFWDNLKYGLYKI